MPDRDFERGDLAQNGLAREPLADIGSLFGEKKGQPHRSAGLLVYGASDRIRTCNPQFTKLLRYRCATLARPRTRKRIVRQTGRKKKRKRLMPAQDCAHEWHPFRLGMIPIGFRFERRSESEAVLCRPCAIGRAHLTFSYAPFPLYNRCPARLIGRRRRAFRDACRR